MVGETFACCTLLCSHLLSEGMLKKEFGNVTVFSPSPLEFFNNSGFFIFNGFGFFNLKIHILRKLIEANCYIATIYCLQW